MKLNVKLILLGLLLVMSCGQAEKPKQSSTWSVVAANPVTGEVGIAAASCFPISIDALAAIVPHKGVAANQALLSIKNRDLVFEMLQAGDDANTILETITKTDKLFATRQYGVITLEDGQATIAGYTGDENGAWAGDIQDYKPYPVTVQGNILEDEAVVSATLAAFSDKHLGPVSLSDRLMRALEAGSAAGGDKRCNKHVKQTAAAAFIMVAQGSDLPFVITDFGEEATEATNAPMLYLSVSMPIGSANPLISLRQQYDEWRKDNLPPCPECNLIAIVVPLGGK